MSAANIETSVMMGSTSGSANAASLHQNVRP